MPSSPFSAYITSMPCDSSTLVSAKTFRTSSSTIRIFLWLKTSSAECSCSSILRFSCGSFPSTRWRKSDVSSSSRSGELTSLTTIDSANFLSFVSSRRVSSLPV